MASWLDLPAMLTLEIPNGRLLLFLANIYIYTYIYIINTLFYTYYIILYCIIFINIIIYYIIL